MKLSRKLVITLLCIALIIRIFSQFIWEAYPAVNLSLSEFIFALFIALGVWLQFEIPKILTCLVAAVIVVGSTKWAFINLPLPRVTAPLVGFSVLLLITCLHAYAWLFVDCQFIQNHLVQEGECVRLIFEPRDLSKWFPF